MKKEKLLQLLNMVPDGIEICVFDWRKNLNDDSGEGSGVGIYPDFELEFLTEDQIPEGKKPWVGLNIKNDDYTDEGRFRFENESIDDFEK